MIAKVIENKEALAPVLVLLQSSKLPFQDITLEGNLFMSYQDEAGNLIGSGGLELYGPYSLIRSIAVDEKQRGKSLGKQIVEDIIQQARSRSLKEIYLLTETAHDFFIHIGFKDVSRDLVPDAVKASPEFISVCPVSAACMVYHLQ